MTVAKKIGTNQLQKMATYKNDCAQKNLNQTAQVKKMRLIKMTVAKKIGTKQLKIKSGTFEK